MKDGDPSPDDALATAYGDILNGIAAHSIHHGLTHGSPRAPVDVPPALAVPRATFVTLERGGELRGCIGGLEARRALAQDVAAHAFAAAFQDPRFAPLRPEEWPGLVGAISILSPPVAMDVHSEAEALAVLRPGIDGLVLSDGRRRGVFLPKVWEDVPDPVLFLGLLRQKAGLPPGAWTPDTRLERFTVALVPDTMLSAALNTA